MKKDVTETEEFCTCCFVKEENGKSGIQRPLFEIAYRWSKGDRIETPDNKGDELGEVHSAGPSPTVLVGKVRLCEYCDGHAVQRARLRK